MTHSALPKVQLLEELMGPVGCLHFEDVFCNL